MTSRTSKAPFGRSSSPISVVALRMDEPFEVVTGEEIMSGNPGDWVLKGVMGEVYVCPAGAFALTYRITKE